MERDTITALILCVFLGWLGVHRFYLGRRVSGVFYLLTLGFCGIGVIIDMFRITYGNFEVHENHEYGYTGDITDTLNALGLSVEDVEKSKPLMNGYKKAKNRFRRKRG